MASLNKVTLIGNLGADPESRSLNNGGEVVNLRIATTESWTKDGQKNEKTEWHQVVIFNENLARVAKSYLHKGSPVYLEGQLQTRKWTDNNGNDRYSTEIVLQKYRGELILLGSKGDGSQGAPTQRSRPQPATADIDDDIPFASCDPALEWRVG
jgi:single-strand DNA-binding protein